MWQNSTRDTAALSRMLSPDDNGVVGGFASSNERISVQQPRTRESNPAGILPRRRPAHVERAVLPPVRRETRRPCVERSRRTP